MRFAKSGLEIDHLQLTSDLLNVAIDMGMLISIASNNNSSTQIPYPISTSKIIIQNKKELTPIMSSISIGNQHHVHKKGIVISWTTCLIVFCCGWFVGSICIFLLVTSSAFPNDTQPHLPTINVRNSLETMLRHRNKDVLSDKVLVVVQEEEEDDERTDAVKSSWTSNRLPNRHQPLPTTPTTDTLSLLHSNTANTLVELELALLSIEKGRQSRSNPLHVFFDWPQLSMQNFHDLHYLSLETILAHFPHALVKVLLPIAKQEDVGMMSKSWFQFYQKIGHKIDLIATLDLHHRLFRLITFGQSYRKKWLAPYNAMVTETTESVGEENTGEQSVGEGDVATDTVRNEETEGQDTTTSISSNKQSPQQVPYHLLTYIRLLYLWKKGGIFIDFSFFFQNDIFFTTSMEQGFYFNSYCLANTNAATASATSAVSSTINAPIRIYHPKSYDSWIHLQCFTSTLLIFRQSKHPLLTCVLKKFDDAIFQICIESDTFYQGAPCIQQAFHQCSRDLQISNDLQAMSSTAHGKEGVVKDHIVLLEDFHHDPLYANASLLLDTNPLDENAQRNDGHVVLGEEIHITIMPGAASADLPGATTPSGFNVSTSASVDNTVLTKPVIARIVHPPNRHAKVLWLGHLAWSNSQFSSRHAAPLTSRLAAISRRNAFLLQNTLLARNDTSQDGAMQDSATCEVFKEKIELPKEAVLYFNTSNLHTTSSSKHSHRAGRSPQCSPSLFLVGFPHIGSRILQEILTLHPAVLSGWHRTYDGQGCYNVRDLLLFKSTGSEAGNFIERLVEDRAACFPYRPSHSGSQSFVTLDQSLQYFMDPMLPYLILQDNPHAKVIFVLTHPVQRLYEEYLLGLSKNDKNVEGDEKSEIPSHYFDDLILEDISNPHHSISVLREMLTNATSIDDIIVRYYQLTSQLNIPPMNELLLQSMFAIPILHFQRVLGSEQVIVLHAEDILPPSSITANFFTQAGSTRQLQERTSLRGSSDTSKSAPLELTLLVNMTNLQAFFQQLSLPSSSTKFAFHRLHADVQSKLIETIQLRSKLLQSPTEVLIPGMSLSNALRLRDRVVLSQDVYCKLNAFYEPFMKLLETKAGVNQTTVMPAIIELVSTTWLLFSPAMNTTRDMLWFELEDNVGQGHTAKSINSGHQLMQHLIPQR